MKARAYATGQSNAANPYSGFDQIDGTHPFKKCVKDGYVDYRVRTRKGGKVLYFNFELAREMGLISKKHGDELTKELRDKILETFALVIINEYDEQKGIEFDPREIRPNRYMATRYLQLQHPDKRGSTSGDGRGIWNGTFKARQTGLSPAKTWDVSSQGTGATRLSPACAIEKKFFKTGDPRVAYGNGCSYVDEGLSAAVTSEIFHRRGIRTERTLAVIEFENGQSITVRSAPCLIRPAHFFKHLKTANLESLKGVADLYTERQIENGEWARKYSMKSATKAERYAHLATAMAENFAEAVARFQVEYIFCWLDWDGDNILCDGGIIDYGSVRMFGLYHREYRYDDVDRFSTNIPEQRSKARYIVQTFAQISDFLVTGRKRNIKAYKDSPATKLFDKKFNFWVKKLTLKKLGLSEEQASYLMKEHAPRVSQFLERYRHFERTKSARGIYEVSDGITCDAVFSVRNLVRELPRHYCAQSRVYDAEEFIQVARSSFAKPRDLVLSSGRVRAIRSFQTTYLELMSQVARRFHRDNLKRTLLEVQMRCSVQDPKDRITGDGIIHVTNKLVRNRKKLQFQQLQAFIRGIIDHQTCFAPVEAPKYRGRVGKLLEVGIEAIQDCREGF